MSADRPTIVYGRTKKSTLIGLFGQVIKGFYKGYGLGRQLAIRDIRAQYRQSLLGIFWAVITPVAQALLWIFLGNRGVLNIDDTGVPYPIFVLTGIMLWQTFLESLNSPIAMFNSSKNILRKINITKESLVIAGVLKVLFNLVIKLVVLIPVMIYFGIIPGVYFAAGLLAIAVVIYFGTIIGVWMTPIGALYTDVQRFIGSFAQLLFFLTPIIYPMRTDGVFGLMDRLNPVAISICNAREMLLGSMNINWTDYSIFLAVIAVVGLLGLSVYRVSLPIIVERMGS